MLNQICQYIQKVECGQYMEEEEEEDFVNCLFLPAVFNGYVPYFSFKNIPLNSRIYSLSAELDTLQIPVGGDQLTRVRFQGAKTLRAGAHTKQERFDQLYPIVIELFHTLQDFLEKLCKRFLKLGNSRDQGTLANLKILIQRSNVNGKVKSRFKFVFLGP
ncbi:uncharacterized protein LOC127726061 isoform X3 [Mytilus californianus]|uniref:uncharacterized protein LOC127726061 isoform X3 n=1 Tax=Mytilus californianus TaxID=6549 RepID=UPI002246F4E7|nr:uncharacterized protein LOC127726061 isoform X3 [Mytilus californianus]